MKRLMLKVAYDGTLYHGWAFQEGQKTVAGTLIDAIRELTGEEVELEGASRTDAGVHAMMNIAVFDTSSSIPPDKFCAALNTRLPEDITVRSSEEVSPDFSIRKAHTVKTYSYSIFNSDIADPLKRLYTYQVKYKLDADKMHEAAQYLVGKHDFKSFCSVHTQALTTIREITDISAARDKEMIRIEVSGYGFLYNMVRIISGTLIEIGRGRLQPEDMKNILSACDRSAAGPTAPPQGLLLEKIKILA